VGQIRRFPKKILKIMVTNDSKRLFMRLGIGSELVFCPTKVNKNGRSLFAEVPYLSHEGGFRSKKASLSDKNPDYSAYGPIYTLSFLLQRPKETSFDRLSMNIRRSIRLYRLALRNSLITNDSVCFRGTDKEKGGTDRVFRGTLLENSRDRFGISWDRYGVIFCPQDR
jgi:hypothetical protein